VAVVRVQAKSKLVITWQNLGKYEDSPENHCYAKVVLDDNVPVDDSFSGCETPIIVGEFLICKSD
jgi:hypothetical protein